MDVPALEFPDRDILNACAEAESRQLEMLPLLASALSVAPEAVFRTWTLRQCGQSGAVPGSSWRYFFHGLECDLKNAADGRFLRLDFGPGGRIDTLSAWGILQFIMTSTPPWSDWTTLKQLFADTDTPYDQNSGNFAKFCEYWNRLDSLGCFEPADPALLDFLQRCTTMDSQGIQLVRFPSGTPEEMQIDCSVSHRLRLSPRARDLLEAQRSERHGR